jgi:ABC-type transport system involved in multi-copper enzyme maturation permease subunit
MIFHIAKKEFVNNLFSARFVIGFLLCIVLIPFSVLINIDEYREQTSLYQIDRDGAEKSLKEVRVYSALRPTVVIPPEPMSIFGRGISGQVGNIVNIQLGEKPLLAEGKTAARNNPFLASFYSVDFVNIAAIIFALLALLFSYDAITREKEDGTLRQQMANPLGRSQLLAGKVAGILLTLLPILVFCFLLGAVIILASGNLAFSAREWGRLALLAVVSLAYLLVFVMLGLFVSARTKTSVTSLVICLFLWTLFVFIIPNLSSTFAESFVGIQSRDNLDQVLSDMDKAARERIAEATKSLPRPDWDMSWYMNAGDDGYQELYGCSASYYERDRQRMAIAEPLRIDNADRKWGPQQAYLDSLSRQAGAADRLAMISPAGIFRIVASAVCGTDRRAGEKRMDDVRRYRETFLQYLQGKSIFASFSYFTPVPPASFKSADQLVAARTGGKFKSLTEYDTWAGGQTDFRARFQILRTVDVPGEKPDDYPFLVFTDLPRFPDRPTSVIGGIENSIVRLGLLLFESLLLFTLSTVAFLRYDVR